MTESRVFIAPVVRGPIAVYARQRARQSSDYYCREKWLSIFHAAMREYR